MNISAPGKSVRVTTRFLKTMTPPAGNAKSHTTYNHNSHWQISQMYSSQMQVFHGMYVTIMLSCQPQFIPDWVFFFPIETEWFLRCWIFHAVLFCFLQPCISLGLLFDSGFMMRVVCVFPDLCSFLRC